GSGDPDNKSLVRQLTLSIGGESSKEGRIGDCMSSRTEKGGAKQDGRLLRISGLCLLRFQSVQLLTVTQSNRSVVHSVNRISRFGCDYAEIIVDAQSGSSDITFVATKS